MVATIWTRMISGIFMGYVLRGGRGEGREDGQATCSLRTARTFTSNVSKHQEVAQEGKLLCPCADGSLKHFDRHAAEGPPRQTFTKMKKKKKSTPSSTKKTGKTLGA